MKAYTRTINPIGYGPDENVSVNQSSPGCVLTFIRWEIRDTLRTNPVQGANGTIDYSTVRNAPLVVENDCIKLSVVQNKGTYTPSMEATLLMTDVDYETEIAPGDFVFVNMTNYMEDLGTANDTVTKVGARGIAKRAYALQAINNVDDGFKGLFRVQTARKILAVIDPEVGTKAVIFKITGYGFSEFNNLIYFNPNLLSQEEQESNLLFLKNFNNDWQQILNALQGINDSNLQELMKFLIDSFIGCGINDSTGVGFPHKNLNTHFYMPANVGKLLGTPDVIAAKDIYNYVFGIQQYSAATNQTLSQGMNPSNLVMQGKNYWNTGNNSKVGGYFVPASGFWNKEKAWSIMTQFVNDPLNEMYTCFRVSPNGNIMPTIVFRQVPFTNEDFSAVVFDANGVPSVGYNTTRFLTIPRWEISPAITMLVDIGRSDAARINYVEYNGNSFIGGDYTAMQAVASKNYLYDIDDVKRSGLRPAIYNTPYDVSPNSHGSNSPIWAKIVGDFMMGGHLKFNGTIQCLGIQDPITVGDNLQFDGVVYHIEQVVHEFDISVGNGKKKFRTTLSLSHGVSIASELGRTRYAQMTNPNAYKERQVDWQHEQILPGVSESQDILPRQGNIDKEPTGNSPFVQPNIGTSVQKSERNS